MQVPAEITFNRMPVSEYNEEYIRERIRRLENMADDIIACRVLVERPHAQRHTGNPYRVRVELTLPKQRELVVDKERNVEPYVELSTVIRNAFDTLERRLKKRTTRRRDLKVQWESDQPHAMVSELFKDEGYGFLRTDNGQEYYVHRNSVLHDDFDRLEIGTEVRFAAELGEQGPQASSVQIVSKPS